MSKLKNIPGIIIEAAEDAVRLRRRSSESSRSYAEDALEAAHVGDLLAALEAGCNEIYPRLLGHAISTFNMSKEDAAVYVDKSFPSLAVMRAALVAAKGDTDASN
jgi:hypothetical protein